MHANCTRRDLFKNCFWFWLFLAIKTRGPHSKFERTRSCKFVYESMSTVLGSLNVRIRWWFCHLSPLQCEILVTKLNSVETVVIRVVFIYLNQRSSNFNPRYNSIAKNTLLPISDRFAVFNHWFSFRIILHKSFLLIWFSSSLTSLIDSFYKMVLIS